MVPPFPVDTSVSLRYDALRWLKKYGITDEEIRANDLRWSAERQWLIFPIYGYKPEEADKVIGYATRNFNGQPNYAKSLFFGIRGNAVHIIGYDRMAVSDVLVVVEDPISAIKVGRHYPCLCLFGSNLSAVLLHRVRTVMRGFAMPPRITLWLDNDKASEAARIAQEAISKGMEVNLVVTLQDPKTYTDPHIRGFVEDSYEKGR